MFKHCIFLGVKMQWLIYSLFIVIFKASMYCQKTFFIVYLILTNKVLLKTNQNEKYFAYNFCTGETWCCFQTKWNISVSAKMSWKISAYRILAKIQYRASQVNTHQPVPSRVSWLNYTYIYCIQYIYIYIYIYSKKKLWIFVWWFFCNFYKKIHCSSKYENMYLFLNLIF